MGTRYEGIIECPYCKKKTEFYYAPSSNITNGKCEHCNKKFEIVMSFKGIKKKQKSLYIPSFYHN